VLWEKLGVGCDKCKTWGDKSNDHTISFTNYVHTAPSQVGTHRIIGGELTLETYVYRRFAACVGDETCAGDSSLLFLCRFLLSKSQ